MTILHKQCNEGFIQLDLLLIYIAKLLVKWKSNSPPLHWERILSKPLIFSNYKLISRIREIIRTSPLLTEKKVQPWKCWQTNGWADSTKHISHQLHDAARSIIGIVGHLTPISSAFNISNHESAVSQQKYVCEIFDGVLNINYAHPCLCVMCFL